MTALSIGIDLGLLAELIEAKVDECVVPKGEHDLDGGKSCHNSFTLQASLPRYVAFGVNEGGAVNNVALIGNLATDVDLKDFGEDKKVANFLLAVDRRSKEGGADFISIAAWNKQGELCAQYLAKGRRVAIDGYLRSRSWEEEGKRRSALEVVARSVQFLSGPEQPGEVMPFEPAVAS